MEAFQEAKMSLKVVVKKRGRAELNTEFCFASPSEGVLYVEAIAEKKQNFQGQDRT